MSQKELKFSIVSNSETHARATVNIREFNFIVDEPEALGGTNQAPNPVEYLLAGYAGCLNVVAHITARELGITPKGLKIAIEGGINPDRLLGKSFDDRAGYKNLEVKLTTSNTIHQGLKIKWLKEIELRCPVNDNLQNPTPVKLSIN